MKEKAGLDTGFFVKLLEGHDAAREVYGRIANGEITGVVSVITVFELRRLALRGVVDREAYELLENSWPVMFQVELVSRELALEAASVSHGTGLPAADAIIYTTCRKTGCRWFYTTDSDYKAVMKKRPEIIFL